MADELISRQALLKKYCKEPANGECDKCDWQGDSWCRCEIFGVLVDDFPAVDAVPVVLCKDCRSCYDGPDDYCCTNHKGLVSITPESFCSYGERRADE